MIEVRALGPLAVRRGERELPLGGPRQRRLLAVLLINEGSVVSVDRIAEAVFAGEPTDAAATTIRSYVARMRRVVGDNDGSIRLVTRNPGYLLQLGERTSDVARFEALIGDAIALRGHDDARAVELLLDALALWRGDPYEEFDDEPWVQPEAQRLHELRLVAYEHRFDAGLACGRAGELIAQIERLAREHPLRDRFQGQLMLALHLAGRQVDALRAFQAHRTNLAEQVGLDPSPSLLELEQRILAHDPTLEPTAPAARPLRGYLLAERLGTGRDSTVHAARLPGVERELVVRVFGPEVADRPDVVSSFEVAVQRASSVRHPALVALHDWWREPGAAYVVSRRVLGGTLADRVERAPLDPVELAALVSRIGGALIAIERAGLTHGRVSARNVMLDHSGNWLLADFGLPCDCEATVRGDAAALAELLCEVAAWHTPLRAAVDRTTTVAELVEAVERSLAVDDRADRPPINPYKGLRPFDEIDADDLHGRSTVVDAIVDRLRSDDHSERFVLVVGGSGTGKSSIVRAGVVPRLRRGSAGDASSYVVTFVPGASPFSAFADAVQHVAVGDRARDDIVDLANRDLSAAITTLVPGDGELLIVIDQFEELFTLCSEHDQRRFLDELVRAVNADDARVRVIATLRADFYDRPLAVPGFASIVGPATVTVPAMLASELADAIVGPARRVGRDVEPALVAELVAAVGEAAALPALQFTLYELADMCDDMLTLDAYLKLGGLAGAIATRAESIYRSLDTDERDAVRRLFEQLVVINDANEPTRRRAARSELATPGSQTDAVVDRWIDARLLTADRDPVTRVPTVELAHEALLHQWPRLRSWLDEDRHQLRLLTDLRIAAAAWNAGDRDPGGLLRGARLQAIIDAADRRSGALPSIEREFLTAAIEERDRDNREAEARVTRQARQNRRLRIQLVALGLALLVAVGGGFLAVDQRREAGRQQRVASARELAAAAAANVAIDPERSMLLALAAVETSRRGGDEALPEAIEALHRSVAASRIQRSVPGVGGDLDLSPDGTLFLTEGPEETGVVDFRSVATGDSVLSFKGHEVDVNSVAFSPSGHLAATTGDDGALRVWDSRTGAQLNEFSSAVHEPVWRPTFSPDGSLVAASWVSDEVLRVFDRDTDEIVLEAPTGGGTSVSFAPDGASIAFVQPTEGYVSVLDLASGREVMAIRQERAELLVVSYSPDGRWLAVGNEDATTSIFDAASGEQRFLMGGHTGPVNAMDWSADGTRLVTASDDGTALVWEVGDGGVRELLTFSAHDLRSGVAGVAITGDGHTVLTSDWSIDSVKVWDASPLGGGELANLPSIRHAPGDLQFTPDSASVFATSPDGVTQWDLSSTEAIGAITPRGDGEVRLFKLDQTGERMAVTTGGLPVEIWDVRQDRHVVDLDPGDDVWFVSDAAWSPDGEHLAIGLMGPTGNSVVVMDMQGNVKARLEEQPNVGIRAIRFSVDGTRLLVVRDPDANITELEGTRVWDWRAGTVERTLPAPAMNLAIDPTGQLLVTTRPTDRIGDIWDAATGEHVATLVGSSVFYDIEFSPDGSQLVTGGPDGGVRTWDARTGAQTAVLRGHTSAVTAVTFSPDGTRIASSGADGVVRLWAAELDELVAIAEAKLTRSLTDDECRQYLHLAECAA